jgi:hypothetical protein
MQRSTNNDEFLTRAELIARWKDRITDSTLKTWKSRGIGPQPMKIGRDYLYRLSDVIAYEKSKQRKIK